MCKINCSALKIPSTISLFLNTSIRQIFVPTAYLLQFQLSSRCISYNVFNFIFVWSSLDKILFLSCKYFILYENYFVVASQIINIAIIHFQVEIFSIHHSFSCSYRQKHGYSSIFSNVDTLLDNISFTITSHNLLLWIFFFQFFNRSLMSTTASNHKYHLMKFYNSQVEN